MLKRVLAAALVFLAFLGATAADASAQALTFTRIDRATDPGARAIVAADFDGDGVIDLATASGTRNSVAILINFRNGGGSFGALHKYTVGAGPFAMAVADVNGDGSPDIVVAAADSDVVNVLLNHGDGTFAVSEVAAPGSPRGIAAADIDHDGHVDLIYTSYSVDTVAVLFGDGTGQFHSAAVSPAGHNPEQVAVADLDGDGDLDLVVANSGLSPLSVFYGNGTGGFRRVDLGGPKQLFAVTIGDFDGDGRPDVAAVSQASKSVAVYFNKTTGLAYSMSLAVPASNARGIVSADFNKDGRADLAVAYRGSSQVAVIAATTGAAGFLPAVMFSAGTGSRALAAADYSGDGKIDLATANEYTPNVTVLTNRSTTPGEGAVAFELHALPSVNPVALAQGAALASGDFNKNGSPDIVADDQVILDGTTPVSVAVDRPDASYTQAVVGDFNGDGNLDFARVARFSASTPTAHSVDAVDVFLGNGAGAFTAGPTMAFNSVRGLVAGDLDNDGRTDLVVLDYVSDTTTAAASEARHVLLGQSDGSFAPIRTTVDAVLFSIGLADLDGDNRLDLFVWNVATQGITVFLGDGHGGFPSSTDSQTAGFFLDRPRIADVNEDGIPDVVGVADSQLFVYLGTRTGFDPPRSSLMSAASTLVMTDLNGDGHLDFLTDTGWFGAGRGDGTFEVFRQINRTFNDAIAVDLDNDGLADIVLNGSGYAAMALFNRMSIGPNLAPIADGGPDLTFSYPAQFEGAGISLNAVRSYDPNLDPLTYQWLDGAGAVLGTATTLRISGYLPGTYAFTLVVRDDNGSETRDPIALTVTAYEEIVKFADSADYRGTWIKQADPTAAASIAARDPNLNMPKVLAPLQFPSSYVDFTFHPDPTQEYKLWVRLKAERNSFSNDSIFVQFDGAVNALGQPSYQIDTTEALGVNLEECSGCGLSGWGWRDDAWGTRGAISGVTLRFPETGAAVRRIRIQTREDGVMVDQVVLSSKKYKSTRPGAVKNDTVILEPTKF